MQTESSRSYVPRAIVLSALVAALLATGCGPAPEPVDRAAVDSILEARYATFSEAYSRANIQLLMDRVYAEDGYYLPPDSPILHGQDQFRGQFSFLERYAREGGPGLDITFDIVDRDVDGDLAYDIGMYTIRTPDSPAEDPGSRGKFVVLWKRIDGEWRIWADAFNAVGETP